MEGFTLDRTLLTAKELARRADGAEKFGQRGAATTSTGRSCRNWALPRPKRSPRGSTFSSISLPIINSSLAPKISLLQAAMENSYRVRFSYLNRGGESERVVEPYYLIFQWSSWYLYAYCEARQGYRLFKLNRMDALTLLPERFEPRAPAPPRSERGARIPDRRSRRKCSSMRRRLGGYARNFGPQKFYRAGGRQIVLPFRIRGCGEPVHMAFELRRRGDALRAESAPQ